MDLDQLTEIIGPPGNWENVFGWIAERVDGRLEDGAEDTIRELSGSLPCPMYWGTYGDDSVILEWKIGDDEYLQINVAECGGADATRYTIHSVEDICL